jgi:hypothetical protein
LRVVRTQLVYPLLCLLLTLSACGGSGGGGGTTTGAGGAGGGTTGNMDVVLTTMSAPSAANAGDTITVQTNVVNQGPTLTGGIAVYYYLSLDNSITVADTYFSFDVILILDPGQSVASSQNITLPANLPSGTYYLGVWADKDNAIAETNDSNNQQVASITITGTTCTEDAYEENDTSGAAKSFVVGTIQSHSHCLDDSDWVAFNAVGGTAYGILTSELGTQADTKLELYDTDQSTLLGEDFDGGYVGESSLLSWTAPSSGTYYLRVAAQQGLKDIGPTTDYNLVIAEAAADLTVSSIGINGSTSLTSGDLVPITYTVANQGVQDATPTVLGAYLSTDADVTTADLLIGTVDITSLTPGSTDSDSLDFWAPLPGGVADGTYYLAVIADHDATLTEMSEQNNVSETIMVTVNAPPCTSDAYEDDDSWQQARAAALDESRSHNFCDDWADYVYVDLVASDTIIIQAFGTADPIDPYVAVYDDTGTYLGGESDNISQNADYVFTAPSSGRYYIAAKTTSGNYGGGYYDRSYDFNIYTQVPDLSVYSANVRQGYLYPGSSGFITTTLQNLGYADATNVNVKFYLSTDNVLDGGDALLGTHLFASVPVGMYTYEDAQIAVPETVTQGAYYLLVSVDPDNLIAETDETNNGNPYDYALTIDTAICAADSYEQNDTPADAEEIMVGESQTHNRCDERLDWLKITTTANQQYLFETSDGSYMRIFDTDTTTELLAGSQYLHWQAPTSGSYYLLSAPEYYLDTSGTNSSTTISVQSCNKDAYESGDTSADAVLITVGESQSRNHCDDKGDWLVFDAVSGTTYTITTSGLGINSDTELTLYDTTPFFTEDYNDDINGSNIASEISWTAPADGRYYIYVENKNIGENTEYTITLTSP